MKFDYVIVGAGLTGCVVAEQLSKFENKKILIIEKRNHIAGNCYDFRNENNIIIHKYGPHIFHTNNKKVWKYLSQFTEWEKYQHRVQAHIDGMLVPVPFNINSIHKCFPMTVAREIELALIKKYRYGAKISILELRKEDNELLRILADYVYDKVFLGYTVKQWDFRPEELDESVTARIPVFVSRDDRYFQDKYQGIPKLGYTKMIKRMINKPNIQLLLNTDFGTVKNDLQYEKLIFTGMLDEYFNFEYGKLPYRSLRFEFETVDLPPIANSKDLRKAADELLNDIYNIRQVSSEVFNDSKSLREIYNTLINISSKLTDASSESSGYTKVLIERVDELLKIASGLLNEAKMLFDDSDELLKISNEMLMKITDIRIKPSRYQPVAQVNYPNEYDYTRITEFIHFYFPYYYQNQSAIAREYPIPFNHGANEIPYYPIPKKENNELADKYKELAKELENVHFVGRLADYKYYNMDQIIERALGACRIINREQGQT